MIKLSDFIVRADYFGDGFVKPICVTSGRDSYLIDTFEVFDETDGVKRYVCTEVSGREITLLYHAGLWTLIEIKG